MKQESNNTNFRRIVTQTVNGKAVIESDGQIENYAFTNVPGYFHSLVWINPAIPDLKKKQTFDRYPDSVVPGPGGSSFHVVTYPLKSKYSNSLISQGSALHSNHADPKGYIRM